MKAKEYAELGFRCQVHGAPTIDWENAIDRKVRRFLGAGAAWNYIAMQQAIEDAGLEDSDVSNVRTGLIMGSGGPSTRAIVQAADTTRSKGPRKVGPFEVPKSMSSTNSATLATPFEISGVNYSISSACSTSAHCIGNGAEMIQWGKQDIVFAGGGEELDWTLSVLFDSMNAMSSDFNETPAKASRAYDVRRDGFVIAGGGGVLVLEELEHAKARGAKIYAELVGYGANSDGFDMVAAFRGRRGPVHKLAMEGPCPTRSTTSTHMQPRRRSETSRKSRRSGRCSAIEHPSDLRDEIVDRPFARRGGRAGGDLFAADDDTRLHLRNPPTSKNSTPPLTIFQLSGSVWTMLS